jgi:hypothetical protein
MNLFETDYMDGLETRPTIPPPGGPAFGLSRPMAPRLKTTRTVEKHAQNRGKTPKIESWRSSSTLRISA